MTPGSVESVMRSEAPSSTATDGDPLGHADAQVHHGVRLELHGRRAGR